MNKRLRFSGAALCESTDELRNPFCGWYQIYSFSVGQEPNFRELYLKPEETCALVLLDIGAYRDRDLDETAARQIEQILSFFDAGKKDIILRVVYDREGKGAEHEPSLFSQVIAHIGQLKPLLQQYRDRIVFFEGMLVGSWGEMHGSRFLTPKNMQLLNAALAESTAGIIRAVRRPVHWRMLHQSPPAAGVMVGLYNDAIFGSVTDLGTFASEDSESWTEPWPIERELDFEEQLGAFVPQCGEAVYGEPEHTLQAIAERLRRMHLTCLNGVYDEKILNLWKSQSWEKPDIWQGMNGYDYIGRHLGYRFTVRAAAANADTVTLTVENIGFSGCYQEAEAWLILVESDGTTREYLTDWDIRGWESGKAKTLSWQIPCCEGELYLSVKRKWDGTTIRFANPSTEQGFVFVGQWHK